MAKDERRAGHQRQPANPGSSIKGGSVVAELREADYFVGFFPCCPDGRFRGERAERRIDRSRRESSLPMRGASGVFRGLVWDGVRLH